MKFSSTNDIFSIKKEVTQKPVDQFSQSMKNNDNIKPKKKLSVGNNIGNNIVNNNNIPNNNPKHNRRQSSNIIGRITLKEDTKNKI